jgi:hypothetical protein
MINDRTVTAIDGWNDVAVRISQAYVTARIVPEGIVLTADVSTFAADPPDARAAYEAALERRAAADDAGYRAALASIESQFPGTRAARRAEVVRAGAPYAGALALLMATMGRFTPKK